MTATVDKSTLACGERVTLRSVVDGPGICKSRFAACCPIGTRAAHGACGHDNSVPKTPKQHVVRGATAAAAAAFISLSLSWSTREHQHQGHKAGLQRQQQRQQRQHRAKQQPLGYYFCARTPDSLSVRSLELQLALSATTLERRLTAHPCFMMMLRCGCFSKAGWVLSFSSQG